MPHPRALERVATFRAAGFQQPLGQKAVVGRTKKSGNFQIVSGGGDWQDFPVSGMGGKNNGWFAAFAKLDEIIDSFDLDAAFAGAIWVEIEELVEKNILGHRARDIAPDLADEVINLLCALFREGEDEILPGQFRPWQDGREFAAQTFRDIGGLLRRELLCPMKQQTDELCDRPVPGCFQPKRGAFDVSIARKLAHWIGGYDIRMMILPKTLRLSMRSSAAARSPNLISVSMTGLTCPRAILSIALTMLAFRQPKEPIRRN